MQSILMDDNPAPPPKVFTVAPEQRSFQEFLEPFQSETDRAAALLAAAMLDDKLREILESFLLDSKISRRLLDSPNAALRGFSSRIDAAYALGFLDDAEYKELHIVRDIRNDFAHSWRTLTFETQSVRDRVRNLHIRGMFGLPTGAEPAREHFNYSVIAILITLMYRNRSAGAERRVMRKWEKMGPQEGS
jgi:DNA-binding MltR family transcriptional regulator